jgi:peptidoglycan/LPS O-acetylase OafA/YrhL
MRHIKEFDGLRGLLALWVFATHAVELGPWPAAANPLRANLAVDVFIILSGFVIFHLLSTGEDYRTFITRRWFRLFPVFAVSFLFALALYGWLAIDDDVAFGLAHTNHLKPYLIAHATMLHGAVPEQLLPHSARAILVPAWSISVEWQFYLLAPLLFALAAKPNRRLALVLLALVAARVAHDVAPRFTGNPIRFDMAAFLPLRLEFFAVGIGSYAMWKWLCARNRNLDLPVTLYALLIPLWILIAKKNAAVGLWLAFLFMLMHAHFGSGTRWSRNIVTAFNAPLAQFLGRISYPIYLLHLPMLVFARYLVSSYQPALRAPVYQSAFAFGGLAATIAGAWLLHYCVEQPMIRLGKRITAGWKLERIPPVGGQPVPIQ